MFRQHVSAIIQSRLGEVLAQDMCCDLEKGIYNASLQESKRRGIRCHWENPDFQTIYKSISRRTVSNLDPSAYIGNTRLIKRLLDGEFPAHQIPFMESRELFPESWQDLADEQMKRETTLLEGSSDVGSDMFKCKRCGKAKTRYWEMQTRSADEPMTIFIRCLNCGKEWRQ